MSFRSIAFIVLILITSAAFAADSVRVDLWDDVPGSQVTDLLSSPTTQPVSHTSTTQSFLVSTAPAKPGIIRLVAKVVAPRAGKYNFYVTGTATAALLVGTDAGSLKLVATSPSATPVGAWGWYSAQISSPIDLTAGQKLLVEAIAKTDSPDGCLAVAWRLPNGTVEGPIPASQVEPFTDPLPLPSEGFTSVVVTLNPEPNQNLTPGFDKFVRGAKVVVDGVPMDMSYMLYVPKRYDPAGKWPVLTYLHGMSHQGYDLRGCFSTGPARNLMDDRSLDASCPMMCLFPQLPPGWRWDTPGAGRIVNQLTRALCDRYPQIDRTRLYLTGNSMGGKGTWITALDAPELYAAVIPVSAVDVRPTDAPKLLADLPRLKMCCGGEDGGFTAGSKRMYAALKPVLGDRISLQVFEHEGHSVWSHWYSRVDFYEGLLKYHR